MAGLKPINGICALLTAACLTACLAACQQRDPSTDTAMSARPAFQQSVASNKGLFTLALAAQDEQALPVNRFHNWVITLSDGDGKPVYPAAFAVRGGMPAHGHGLPSQPEVTRHLGDGAYLLEGVKFNMDGAWLLHFHILAGDLQDTAEVRFDVSY